MAWPNLRNYRQATGRRCPRVEPFAANVPVIDCAHELRQFEGLLVIQTDIWNEYTEHLDDERRREFRRRVAVYTAELQRQLEANRKARDG